MLLLTATVFAAGNNVLEVQGVPCAAPPRLDRDGRLKACALAKAHAFAGTTLPAGTEIQFDAGQLASCVLGAPATIAGFALPGRTELKFRNGHPVEARLPDNTTVRGLALPARATVFFQNPWMRETKGSWRCWLPAKQKIQGHLCAAIEDGIGHAMYPGGRLRAIWLAGSETIDGVPCTSGTFRLPFRTRFYGTDRMVWFFEDGRLQQAMVGSECVVQGRTFKPGDIVRFTEDRNLYAGTETLGASSRGPRLPF